VKGPNDMKHYRHGGVRQPVRKKANARDHISEGCKPLRGPGLLSQLQRTFCEDRYLSRFPHYSGGQRHRREPSLDFRFLPIFFLLCRRGGKKGRSSKPILNSDLHSKKKKKRKKNGRSISKDHYLPGSTQSI